jgi:predicted secreted protein
MRRFWHSADALAHNGSVSQLSLAMGEESVVGLRSLAMAGYRWSASVGGDDPEAVAVELRRGELPAGSRPGASAPEEAVVHGVRPGHALVRLEQRRPWEPDNPPAQEIELRVEVRGKGRGSRGEGGPSSERATAS